MRTGVLEAGIFLMKQRFRTSPKPSSLETKRLTLSEVRVFGSKVAVGGTSTAVNPSDENNTGATPGTIAGAVVGSIVGLLALLALPFLFLRWKRKGKSDAEEEDVEAARPFDIRTAQVTSHFPTSKVHPQPPTSDNDPSGQLPPSLSPLSPLRRDADPPAPVPAVNSPPPPVSPLLQSPNHPNSSQPMNLETALGVLVRSIDRQPSANQQHSNDFPPNHPSD